MNGRPHSRQRAALFIVAALVAACLVGASGGPAGAGKCANPVAPGADGRIRVLPAGPLLGNGVYNLDGASQTAFGAVQPGDKVNFEVTYRNASTNTRSITVALNTGTGDLSDFVVKYFRGDKNITDKVDGDGKVFRAISPGSTTKAVRVQVRMKGTASVLDLLRLDVRGAYGKTYPSCGDNVGIEAGPLN